MNSVLIKKDIESFQKSVKKLSVGIGKASSLWKDTKYSGLSAAVREIADLSKGIIVTGEQCCNSIDKMDKISEEKY